ALLDHDTVLGIEHRRLERVLMDVDRRVQHHEPPLVRQRPDRPSTVRTEPYDIQNATAMQSDTSRANYCLPRPVVDLVRLSIFCPRAREDHHHLPLQQVSFLCAVRLPSDVAHMS